MVKKLYYIANIRVPTEKAHGVQIFNMCSALSEFFDVSLVVPKRKNTILGEPFKFYGIQNKFHLKQLSTFFLIPISNPLLFFFQKLLFSLVSTANSICTRPDIIYTRDEYVAYLHSFFFKKVFLEEHVKKDSFIYRQALSRVTGVSVISVGLKEHVKELCPACIDKIVVAPDGVDYEKVNRLKKIGERKRNGLGVEKKVIAYVGKYKTMGNDKGVDDLIEAVASIPPEHDALLLLVGIDPNETAEIREKISQYNVPQVKIIEHVTHNRALSYIVSADILVMNYPDQPHYRNYMSPLKLFEYLASGNVVIASDLPTIREIVGGDHVLFTKPGDVNNLSNILKYALRHFKKLEQMKLNAKQLAKSYSWKNRAEQIINFFKLKNHE